MSDKPLVNPTPDLLEELALSLRTNDDFGYTSWLDVEEQRVLSLTIDPEEEQEDDEDAGVENRPDWQREEAALAGRIRANHDRYRRIPALGTAGRLHEFLNTLEDPSLEEALRKAARGGRGAYRRVRDVLHRRGKHELWHEFEAQADREMAMDWLRSEQLVE